MERYIDPVKMRIRAEHQSERLWMILESKWRYHGIGTRKYPYTESPVKKSGTAFADPSRECSSPSECTTQTNQTACQSPEIEL